jgi:hypothetical protein
MRNPNARDLAMRDPAMAALMGAIDGSDFGADPYRSPFANDYGAEPAAVATAVVPAGGMHPHHPHHHWGGQGGHPGFPGGPGSHSEARRRLLDPNFGSDIRVGRYLFSVNQQLVLGTPSSINATGQPDTTIRPQRVTMNAPVPGFATIAEIKVANVSVTIGGTADAFDFIATGIDQSLDMPTLTPANRASILGNYTGIVPPGMVGAGGYLFVASFKGPATLDAG